MNKIYKVINIIICVVALFCFCATLFIIYGEGLKGNPQPVSIYQINLVGIVIGLFTGGNAYLLNKGENK